MKYLEITLSGFKRIAITGYDTISIKPHSPLQLILGTNGSGKSQLMNEITPLPANKDAFKKEGFKKVIVEHDKEIYTLITTFKSGTKCQFIRHSDNEELNPGGTQAVQLELIKSIFNYDINTARLLHSAQIFTNMAPIKRREYFTNLSTISYDYALAVWSKIKDALRDNQGAIKNLKKRILSETSLSETDETEYLETLEKEIKNRETDIQRLMNILAPFDHLLENSKSSYQEKSDTLFKDIEQSASILRKARSYVEKNGNNLSRSSLESRLQLILDDLNAIEGKLSVLYQEFQQQEQKVNTLNQDNNHDVGQLNKQRDQLLQQLNEEKIFDESFNEHHTSFNQNQYHAVKQTVLNLIDSLDYYLTNYPDTQNLLNQDDLNKLNQEHQKLTEEVKELDSRRIKGLTLIQEMQEHKQNGQHTCPKCQHTWIPGYDDQKLLNMKKRLEEIITTFNLKEIQLKKVHQEVQDQTESLRIIKQYQTLLKQYQSSITYLTLNQYSPKDLISQLNQYQGLLNKAINLEEIKQNLKQVDSLLELAKKSDQNVLMKEKERLKALETQFESFSLKKKELMESKKVIETNIRAINALEVQYDQLTEMFETYDQNNVQLLNRNFAQTVRETIQQQNLALADLIKQKNRIEVRTKVLENLQKELNELIDEEKHLKLLVDELSPTHGLIADSLLGFIKAFVTEMNNIIKQIWSYPLSIKLPDFEPGETELSYKFPMMVGNDDDSLIPDVSMGSTGIKEVVDLAFKLTAMKVSGIGNYPLFLDEFGASFDAKHRAQASHVIKSLMEQKNHKQLFMVSHYVDSYGSLVNADVIVLNPDNITLPTENYNEYTTFSNEPLIEEN